MRYLGFSDARCTNKGSDGGIDVVSSMAVAQVKAQQIQISRPLLQQLTGVASVDGKAALFFSLEDYSRDAKAWAQETGMHLFRFDYSGGVEPTNASAAQLLTLADGSLANTPGYVPATAPTVDPRPFAPLLITDAAAVTAIERQRQGVVRRDETAGVFQAWIPMCVLDITVTTPARFRGVQAQTFPIVVDALIGAPFLLTAPPLPGNASPPPRRLVWPAWDLGAAQKVVERNWKKARTLKTPEGRAPYQSTLRTYGIPTNAHSCDVHRRGEVLVPAFIGILQAKGGQRAVVVDGTGGSLLGPVGRALTAKMHQTLGLLETAARRIV